MEEPESSGESANLELHPTSMGVGSNDRGAEPEPPHILHTEHEQDNSAQLVATTLAEFQADSQ